MKEKDLNKFIEDFKSYFKESPVKEISAAYYVKERWFHNDPQISQIPLAASPGVYVYLIQDEVVYIGMSKGKLGQRVCAHLGAPDHQNKTFPYHQWTTWEKHPNESGLQVVCDNIKSGELRIITITVEPNHFAPALESFLLEKGNGQLLLNIQG